MGYLHGLSQPSVSRALREVVDALNHPNILARHIYFPRTRQERQSIINGRVNACELKFGIYYRFANKFGFPGCLGCVDCTHVAVVKPREQEERFFNRKRYHSRNVQIICDSDLNVLHVDATFGDSAYPLRPWMLTPIAYAQPDSPEAHYTQMHCSTRNTVERCIGSLKARWRCLLVHRVLLITIWWRRS
nr:unnamed protein product [Callosobruchus chinensis]